MANDAVNEFRDRVLDLRERHGDRDAQEAVCLACRYALALFLPAWLEESGQYDPEVVQTLMESMEAALKLLPPESQYYESVHGRQKELQDFLSGKRHQLVD
jgi:hypothetical protein